MVFIALLRGVNVGGGNKVPMAELRGLATGLGWQNVQTYIASGNLVFESDGEPDELAGMLRRAMADALGVDVPVLVLPADVMITAHLSCPFPPEPGNLVHGFFCIDQPQLDEEALADLRAPSEAIAVAGNVVWLHAPEGVGRSKLMAKIDKVIRETEFTARNLNTIRTLAQMAQR